MNIKTIITVVALSTMIFACKSEKNKTSKKQEIAEATIKAPEHKEAKHWSYEGETGPEHWAEFVKNSQCGGEFQSPINIISLKSDVDNTLKALDLHYAKSTKIHNVTNNGHSVQYNFEAGNYINYKGEKYALKQIHFHESAEHTIDGVRYPMVIHMVHVSAKGKYVVLATMVKEGETSAPFTFLEQYLPVQKGETKTIDQGFDLNLNLPKDKGYYNYVGSLTTPPCTEGVNWFIFKNPISITTAQLKEIQKLMPKNNYRNEKPLHGRKVKQTK